MTSHADELSADPAGRPGSTTERRRERTKLEVSREAARLFWEQGVASTSGEQIAAAAGLSVRTLWRYFRNKESCVEPIVKRGVAELVELLDRWPAQRTLEEHFTLELEQRASRPHTRAPTDDLLSVQMVGLGDTEPAIRAAWLMACDQVEGQLAIIVAGRLHRAADDPTVRRHAAAAAAAVRVVNEDVSRALLAGHLTRVDAPTLARQVAVAVRTATGGAVGDALAPAG